jgi:hypothetical protein
MNPVLMNISGFRDACEKIVDTTEPVSDEFIEKNRDALGHLSHIFEEKGGIHVIEIDSHAAIFRVPSQTSLSNNMKALNDGKEAFAVQKAMISDCLIYPSPDAVARWFEARPGLPVAFANELTVISGLTAKAVRKKL